MSTTLTARPLAPVRDVDEARGLVEPNLRDIEVEWAMTGVSIQFVYSSAICDKQDESSGLTKSLNFAATVGVSASASMSFYGTHLIAVTAG